MAFLTAASVRNLPQYLFEDRQRAEQRDRRADKEKLAKEKKLVADAAFEITQIQSNLKDPDEISSAISNVLEKYKDRLSPEMIQFARGAAAASKKAFEADADRTQGLIDASTAREDAKIARERGTTRFERGGTTFDLDKQLKEAQIAKTKLPAQKKPAQTRTRQVGNENVVEQWDGTKWVEISRGPKFKPTTGAGAGGLSEKDELSFINEALRLAESEGRIITTADRQTVMDKARSDLAAISGDTGLGGFLKRLEIEDVPEVDTSLFKSSIPVQAPKTIEPPPRPAPAPGGDLLDRSTPDLIPKDISKSLDPDPTRWKVIKQPRSNVLQVEDAGVFRPMTNDELSVYRNSITKTSPSEDIGRAFQETVGRPLGKFLTEGVESRQRKSLF